MRPPNLRTDGAFSLLLLLLLLLFDLTFHTGRRERPFSLVNSTTRRSDAINVGGPPARLLSFLFINYISLFLLLLSFAPRRIYSNRMMEREILYISTCSIVSIADCCCCCCWLSLDDKRNLQGPFPSAAGLDAPKVANHDILLCVCVEYITKEEEDGPDNLLCVISVAHDEDACASLFRPREKLFALFFSFTSSACRTRASRSRYLSVRTRKQKKFKVGAKQDNFDRARWCRPTFFFGGRFDAGSATAFWLLQTQLHAARSVSIGVKTRAEFVRMATAAANRR